MNAALIGALVTLVAPQPITRAFHPAEGKVYRYTITQQRTDGTTKRRFTAERRATFRKRESGWRAEVVLERTTNDAAGDVGGMFAAAMAGLQGRTVSFDLDDRGTVLSIDDLPTVWAAAMEAIEQGLGSTNAARATSARTITATLRQLPPARQSALLASMITPLIDAGAANRQVGEKAVHLPSASPVGAPITVDGSETVTILPDGIVMVSTTAAATVTPSTPPGTPGANVASTIASATIRLDQMRHIDPQSGLVLMARDSNETCTTGAQKACVTTVTELTVL